MAPTPVVVLSAAERLYTVGDSRDCAVTAAEDSLLQAPIGRRVMTGRESMNATSSPDAAIVFRRLLKKHGGAALRGRPQLRITVRGAGKGGPPGSPLKPGEDRDRRGPGRAGRRS